MNQNDDELVGRLQQLGSQPIDPATQAMHLTAMGAARARRPATSKLRIAAALVAGFMLGSSGLAAADALPDPVQHVAHTALSHVGVDVPNPARYHGPECGAEVKRNHGAYVSANHALAKTDCGKPIHDKSKDKGAKGTDPKETDSSDDKGPCHGKPPWAGNKTMTAEEKAAAEAARNAQCPDDDQGTDEQGTKTETNKSATLDEPATTTTEAVTTTTSTTTPTSTTEAPAVDEAPSTTTTNAT